MHKVLMTGYGLLATTALILPCDASAQLPSGGLRVQGIEIAQPDISAKGALQSAILKSGQLSLTVQGLRSPLTVAPWVSAWPSSAALATSKSSKQGHNQAQEVQIYRTLNPFGPTQRITLQRSHQTQPWLSVQTGAQSGQQVLADWTVMNRTDRWWLVQGTQPDSPRMYVKGVQTINAHNALWCFYPSARQAGPEQPALLDWVLVQQSPGRKSCPA